MDPQALLKGMSPMPGEGSPWARMRESFEDIVKGAGLVIGGHRQWLSASWFRSIATVTAPYLLFLGIWSIFAF